MKTKFNVIGMNCNSCVKKIEEGFANSNLSIAISLENKEVIVESMEDFSNMTIKKTIEELGFAVEGMKKV
ncbi:MAG: heavy-metal-associated domain-containing protein [Bacteriovoracaceae bacterium]|jgi:copper chaperone CopZ|nr:heavy-metal-associated domain-containing protein [Bacteriovoracaceae bacterium]